MRVFMGVHARLVLIAISLLFAHGGCSSESESAPRDVMATLEDYHAALAASDVSWVVLSMDGARGPLRADARQWLAECIAAHTSEEVSAGKEPPISFATEWRIVMDDVAPDAEALWIGISEAGPVLLGKESTGLVYDLIFVVSEDEARDVVALLERGEAS